MSGSPYEIIFNDLFRFDLLKPSAPPSVSPGIFIYPLLRIAFATLLNKNASPDFVGKGFVARTRFELVSPP
jgi:hypothetical protein